MKKTLTLKLYIFMIEQFSIHKNFQFKKIFIFFLLIVNLYSNEINTKNYYPDFAKIQFAGNIGFLSLGTGYNFYDNKYEMGLFYGFVPKSLTGVNIHTINYKNTYKPFIIKSSRNIEFIPISFGINIAYVFGQNSFVIQPDRYPKLYYPPTSIFTVPFIGGGILMKNLNKKNIKNITFYYELGILDRKIRTFIVSNHIELRETLNISFGMKIPFVK